MDSNKMTRPTDSLTSRLTFRKAEKLHHRSLVDSLFSNGENIFKWPLRLIWRPLSDEELKANFRNNVPAQIAPMQLMITVPKKKLRHAVDRVKMRRRIRESYRLQRIPVRDMIAADPKIRTLSVAIVYMAPELISQQVIDRKISWLLEQLLTKISNTPSDELPSD